MCTARKLGVSGYIAEIVCCESANDDDDDDDDDDNNNNNNNKGENMHTDRCGNTANTNVLQKKAEKELK
jgi:hypothetical protein